MDIEVSAELQCGGMRFDIYVKGDRWCLVVETKIDDFPWENQSSPCEMITAPMPSCVCPKTGASGTSS